jgi:hypothetical protein
MLIYSVYSFSSVGVVAVVYVVILIVCQKYMGNFMPGPVKTGPSHWTDVFLVVPVICFGYQVTQLSALYSLRTKGIYSTELGNSRVAQYTVVGDRNHDTRPFSF